MFAPSSPVTGTAQIGLTSPTYTLTADQAPSAFGRQYAVTALGGTQTGVRTHSASDPFTIAMFRPVTFRAVSAINAATGQLFPNAKNSWKMIVRKGTLPLAGQSAQVSIFTTSFDVVAGADVADSINIRAALSLMFGVYSAQSSALGDSLVTGVL